MRAYNIRVYGRVQRVGYRRFILETARSLKLSGTVKNEPDDTVSIFIQGPDDKLGLFIEKIRSPPPPAYVEDIDIKETEVNPDIKYFNIIYGPLEEELQEGFGAMQSIFMDYWSEFRDYRREFRDFRQEFRDFRQEFRDYRQEFRDFRREFREFAERTDRNFQILMEKYGEISEKLTMILDILVKESKETRLMIYEVLKTLNKALEKLGGK